MGPYGASLVVHLQESTCKAGDPGSIPGWEDPGGNGNSPGSSSRRTAWTAEAGGHVMAAESDTTEHFPLSVPQVILHNALYVS